MRPLRAVLLMMVFVVVGGSLAFTTWYGVRIRSEAYRQHVQDDLTAFFAMPCDVGGVRPVSFDTRAFERVTVWLPDRRDQVFNCAEALWHEIPRPEGEVRTLDLRSGELVLGTDKWQTTDYAQVFRSGLGHDFEDLDLVRVDLSDFLISFAKGGLSIHCGETSGTIDMSDPKEGVATLRAYSFNGYPVSQGVQIHARFLPSNGVEVSELVLQMPTVPLSKIGIDRALGATITSGEFAGGVEYRSPADASPEIWLRGDVRDVHLAEFTQRLPFGPLDGKLSVTLQGARLSGGIVTHVQGRGQISGLSLHQFAPLVKTEKLSGHADLDIQWIDLALGHVNQLSLDGRIEDLSLDEILSPLGRGQATGRLSIRVNALSIAEDIIESADIDISAVPPPGRPGTIDRDLIIDAAGKLAHFAWPDWAPRNLIPDKIEYSRFGVNLRIRKNKLRILGTHGDDGHTILTVKLFGKEFGVVRDLSQEYDLTPWIDLVLDRARTYDPQRVKEWWRTRTHPPSKEGE